MYPLGNLDPLVSVVRQCLTFSEGACSESKVDQWHRADSNPLSARQAAERNDVGRLRRRVWRWRAVHIRHNRVRQEPRAQVGSQLGVHAIHIATSHASGQQRAVGVLDDAVGLGGSTDWVRCCELFQAMKRLVGTCPALRRRHDPPISGDKVRADDDADVVELEALTRVNAAHLFHRLLAYDPEASVLSEVPASSVVVFLDDDVVGRWITPAVPFPAIARHHARAIAASILVSNQVMQLFRRVQNAKVELVGAQPFVGCRAYVQRVVDPREVPVRAIASELRDELAFGDGRAKARRPLPERLHMADVTQGDALIVIDEEDRATSGDDQFLDLVLTQVAVQPRLLVEAVRLIDDQHTKGVWLSARERARAGKKVADL